MSIHSDPFSCFWANQSLSLRLNFVYLTKKQQIPFYNKLYRIYSRFYYYYWVDISAGGLLVPECMIRPVVSVSVLTFFIRYIYYWNLQFLIKVISSKLKFTFLTHSWPLLILAIMYKPFRFIVPNTFKLFGFQICRFWAYLIPKTRHAH